MQPKTFKIKIMVVAPLRVTLSIYINWVVKHYLVILSMSVCASSCSFSDIWFISLQLLSQVTQICPIIKITVGRRVSRPFFYCNKNKAIDGHPSLNPSAFNFQFNSAKLFKNVIFAVFAPIFLPNLQINISF